MVNITGTKEWAEKTFNVSSGCANNCRYCYAKCMAVRFNRKTRDNWSEEIIDLSQATQLSRRKRTTSIMFPSTHDITPKTLDTSLSAIKMVLNAEAGHRLLIVSKPRLKCIGRLCEELQSYRARILFRFTMGSANNDTLKFWEPGAPTFEERLESLKLAFLAGYQTSVSSEPMLDDNIDAVIEQVVPFVTDAIWLGKINRLRTILSINGENDVAITRAANELIQIQSDENIKMLYESLKDNPSIKWKESIKTVVGLERPAQAGLDI
ncbi:radical SAM protein [uncultured Victivallis sp.]|uniref:DUF5131 family protein n=1 Tax=uncultured Victivallis sp. TaxID=354118 RepID=UPI00258623AC|nr:radical SAM protein [uncultured Victivallis sp.]